MEQDKKAIKQLQEMVAVLMANSADQDRRLKDIAQVADTNHRMVEEAKRWSQKVGPTVDRHDRVCSRVVSTMIALRKYRELTILRGMISTK